MPFERIDLQDMDERLESAVLKTVDALKNGKLVVLPTETVYGLAVRAGDESAVRRLITVKGRQEGHPMALALSGFQTVTDFVPEMSDLALRLARRCWPGPVSLVLPAKQAGSDYLGLPESVQEVTSKGSFVAFRVPDHLFTSMVLRELDEPAVLTSANRSGKPEATSYDAAVSDLGNDVDLIVDDGSLLGSKPSTVLWIDGDQYSILRTGAVGEETLHRLTARMILFVCTGNTCRSPMAERICEKILADRIGCRIDELERHGFVVLSAGLAAGYDLPASSHAEEILQRQGLDLSGHRSQQLGETHVRFADHIFTMTRGHREAILSYWPETDTRLSVLRTDGGDISDPIGGSYQVYEACARQMETEIEKRIDDLFAGR